MRLNHRMLVKISLIILLFLVWQNGFSQPGKPVLLSDSPSVKIKIDGNIVAEWNINPDTKPWTEPDVFTIERSFQNRHVTYLSNRDSLSFMAVPGGKYDFTVMITNRGAFPLQLATFDEPVFQHPPVIITGLICLVIIGWLVYANRKAIKTVQLLYMGILAPVLFWLLTITGGFIHGNYNHLHNVVSELGAIGTKSESFMSGGEIFISLLSFFSVIGFCRACRLAGLNILPVLTILSLTISMFWAGVFPMHHELHGTLGPVPLLLNIGVLLAIFIWRGKAFLSLRLISGLCFILMMLILLRTVPALRGQWEGLIQRFFYLGWSIWSIALSLFFIPRMETKNKKGYYAG